MICSARISVSRGKNATKMEDLCARMHNNTALGRIFPPDMSGYVKPIKMGIYEILLMRHIYEYGIAYNLEGASPLEMMQATAFECQKKCVDMFPACTAGKWVSKL